jgi:hypothetical protein
MVGHVGAFRTLCVDSETASLAVRLRTARSVLNWVVDSRRVRDEIYRAVVTAGRG